MLENRRIQANPPNRTVGIAFAPQRAVLELEESQVVTSVDPAGYFVPGYHESMPETKSVSFAEDGAGFADQLLDIINPLQHIPIVSTIYRALSGDEIAGPARLIGGALFGGPVGFATAAANMLFEQASGDDLAGHALAFAGDPVEPPGISAAAAPLTAPAPARVSADTGYQPALSGQQANTPVSDGAPVIGANGHAAIVWNAPRVVPSLARAAPAQGEPTPGDNIMASDGAQPPWLGAAIADAQAVQEATQQGHAAQSVAGQPWVSEAMLEALDKYEALARERNR